LNRVIVTGGNGFIGKHLVKKLLSCKLHSLALISNTSNIGDKNLGDRKSLKDMPLTFYNADIRDRKAISNIFRDEKADTCIHLAAKISVEDSIKKPDETMEINVNGTLNILEACYKSQVNNFVFASSAAVYGDVKELPISENCFLRPLSPYGKSKMLAEQHVFSYSKLKKVQNAIALRIFNVYGEGQASEADVISQFAGRLSRRVAPVINGDGMQTRDFISVDDVVDAFLLSISSMEESKNNENNTDGRLHSPPVFNIGTGIPTSVNELAKKMIGMFGLDVQPVHKDGKDRRGILHSYADVNKAREVLHFTPKRGIEAGLKEMIRAMNSSNE
jgi:UDP-glucose 4-epimerase